MKDITSNKQKDRSEKSSAVLRLLRVDYKTALSLGRFPV